MSPLADRPRPGLRERKKAKTRATSQHEALALIGKQGYAATTVGQICEAAEHPDVDVLASVDDALAFLEAGLPIESGDG